MQDAAGIYDEMLEFRPLLENGTVMNTFVPAAEDDRHDDHHDPDDPQHLEGAVAAVR